MKQETKFRICVMPLIITSAIYFGLYIQDNEYHKFSEVEPITEQFVNGEILLPDYVHSDTLVVINAKLLNDEVSNCDGSDGSYSDLLGESTVNIADYKDYMNVVTNP